VKSVGGHVWQFAAAVGLALILGGASAQAIKPVLLWPQPTAIPYQTPLSSLQLDATPISAAPVQVSLSSVANVMGVTTPGYTFLGGFDYDSWAYASELIGTSILWRGVPFSVGAANQNDVVSSTTVPLPAGGYGTLLMLGDMVNNISPSVETFTVNYTDGTSTTVQQEMSDWVSPRNYAGETVVQCYPWRHNLDGTNDQNSVCVYGYSIALDATKTVASVVLPNTRDIVMISFVLLPPVVQGVLTYNPDAGAVLPSGTQTLSANFTPNDPAAYASTTAQVPLTVIPPASPLTPAITWATPSPIVVGTPLGPVQLDAQAAVPQGPVMIPIVPESRVNAIYADGSQFNEMGIDGANNLAYSASQLGSTLTYAGFTFALGPLAVPDAASHATIALPAGSYSTLYVLGTGVDGPQINMPFTIHYADGTTSVDYLDLSSWDAPQGFAGETLVKQTSYADTSKGGQVSGTYDVYGYQLPIDPSRTATSVTLPPNTNTADAAATDVVVLALGVGVGGMASVDGSYVYTPPSGTVLPLGVNPLSVTFTADDTTDLGPATGATTITVVKPTLTVTANDATRIYGTPNPAFTGSITGAQSGDTFTESFSTAATTGSYAGNDSIVPSAQGSDLAAYQEVIVDGTLTITKAPVVVTAAESASNEIQGQPLTFTAKVQSTTTGVPTGSVQFVSNGVNLGGAPLVSGSATLTTQALAVGTDAVIAVYSGDNNFLTGSASTGAAVVVTSADFTFSGPEGLVLTDTWGKTASLKLRVAPLSTVYFSTVSFSLDTGLPPLATSSFSPGTVSANAGPQDVMFTYDSRLLSQARDPAVGGRVPWVPIACGLGLLPLAGLKRLRRIRGMRLLMGAMLALAFIPGLIGCGSGYKSGAFPLTITATDGIHSHSLTVTLDLQAP
jgi:hypothetical protein